MDYKQQEPLQQSGPRTIQTIEQALPEAPRWLECDQSLPVFSYGINPVLLVPLVIRVGVQEKHDTKSIVTAISDPSDILPSGQNIASLKK